VVNPVPILSLQLVEQENRRQFSKEDVDYGQLPI
jgi:hypothetical protein